MGLRAVTLFARTLGLVTWRSPRRTAGRLREFALAEHGSMIDLRIAARLTPSTTRAASYLAHAADEERHARTFRKHAAEWAERAGLPPPGPVHADVEHLFERLGELGFLALVHRGETRGRAELELYGEHFARRGEARTAAIFRAIVEDERRHERVSRELLLEVAGSETAARAALRRAALREVWQRWRRAGGVIAAALYAVTMGVVYVLSAPLALALRLRDGESARWRPAPRG